jgi:hypothetical protein
MRTFWQPAASEDAPDGCAQSVSGKFNEHSTITVKRTDRH